MLRGPEPDPILPGCQQVSLASACSLSTSVHRALCQGFTRVSWEP